MTGPRGKKRASRNQSQILAMALVGTGLLILGALGVVALPRLAGSAAGRQADGSASSAVSVEVNFPAPEVNLTDLDGNAVSLSSFNGQVVLVNNWATWCPPCKAEMPALQAYYEAHREENFTIVAIEAGETVAEVKDFVEQYGLTFTVWPDPEQRALDAFRNNALPNSYLIDRAGTVRLAWNGAISREMLERYVTPLLED